MKAKSIKGKSTEEIKSALEQSMADGFVPTLAICFISKSQDRTAITNLLDEKSISVFGCTTNGEFIDEEPDKASAAILLLNINKGYFDIIQREKTQIVSKRRPTSVYKNDKMVLKMWDPDLNLFVNLIRTRKNLSNH